VQDRHHVLREDTTIGIQGGHALNGVKRYDRSQQLR
jgi:hypothetical protein